MKHYLLNHQPQKGLQTACAQQGQAPTCNARGKGRTPASPKTLTRILLVLLTMFLLPSAAWGQTTYEGGKDGVQDSQLGDDSNRTGTWGSWAVTWDDGITSVRKNQSGKLEFTAIGSKTGHITLSLTRSKYSSEKICSVILSHTSNEVISIQSFKIGDNEINTQDYTHTESTLSYKPNSPIEWAEGKEIKITIEINNTSSATGISELMILTAEVKTATPYNLTVAGITVTDWNKDNVTGKTWWDDNTHQNIPYVSFTPADGTNPATLTLNGAEINYESGNVIVSTLTTPLAVNLSGNSNISSGSNLPFEGATGDNANLVFKCEDSGSLLMSSTHADFSTTSFYTGFNKVLYPEDEGNLYAYLSEDNVVIEPITSYGLTVAGVEVTSANCDDILKDDSYNAGKVSFKPAIDSQKPTPATLTLKGVTIEGRITWSDPEEGLSIIIDGDNTITNSGGALISFEGTSQTSPQLSFSKAEGSGAKTLVLQSDGFPISGFDISSSSTIGDGLKTVSGQTYIGITTKDVYDLWIDGTQVHDIPELPGYKGNILGGTTATVTFDDGSQTLTLNNAEISSTSSTNAIETGLSTLNIDLKGNNSITTEGGYALYGATSSGSYTIIFTSSSDPVGNLTLKNSSGELAIFVTIQSNTGLVSTIITPSDASDLTAAKEAIIAKGTAMGITVAGVVVTSENQKNILGDGKVSFSPAEVVSDQPSTGSNTYATLTLDDGATIEGNIQSSISPLIVHLKGSSTINPSTTNDAPFEYTGDTSSGSPALTFDSTDDEAGKLTMGGTLRKDNSGSNVTLTIGGYSVTNQFDDGTGTNLTGEWIYNSTSGKHHIFRNKLYGLWVGSYQVTRANKSSISSGYPTFDEDNLALRLKEEYTGLTIKSAMPALKLFVKGKCSLKNIIFDTTYNPNSEPGTLTIEKDPDPNDPATNNSLSLSNTDGGGGVITGFSNVTIKAPLHISAPNGFTEWTDAVTSATITDKADDDLLSNVLTEGVDYVTYYAADRDIYLSSCTPYVITGISGSSVVTKAISYIPKGTVAIVDKNSNTATEAVTKGNMLKYADSDNPVTATETSNYYVLYNGKFVKVTRDTTIGGPDSRNGCYLDLSGVAGTRGFYDIDGSDGTTAIKDVKSGEVDGEKWADGGWHDLQGRRLSAKPTKPGLYILNGKKVVIK